jgi:hypothetical protein
MEMKLADSARPKSPQDGVAFIEGFVLPSLEIMDKWQKEGQVLAGGPVAGELLFCFGVTQCDIALNLETASIRRGQAEQESNPRELVK